MPEYCFISSALVNETDFKLMLLNCKIVRIYGKKKFSIDMFNNVF